MKKKKRQSQEELLNNYIESMNTENSKSAVKSLLKKLITFLENDEINDIRDITDVEIDLFLKKELTGKSASTASNTISRIKHLFKYLNKEEVIEHLNLQYIKNITETKALEYLTPSEVYNIIEELINYQDKALILMCYMGLYDKDFETIRTLRKDQVKDDKIVLENGTEIKLNHYCKDIITKAIKEDEMEKYIFQEGRKSERFKLNNNTPYILKSKMRKGSAEILPAITLKKKFELFGKYVGNEKLSAIMIKNSKFIYDLVRLEYEINCGIDINQIALKDYCQEQGMVGQIEKLNMAKKDMKIEIIKDIVNGKTHFID